MFGDECNGTIIDCCLINLTDATSFTSTKSVLLETRNKVASPSILIVEDDEDDIYILKEGFDDLEYKSISFHTDALSAISYLNSTVDEELPALIVTDFNLPAFNGFQFVKFLKTDSRLSNIPVVVLTTSMSAINRKSFLDEGVARVIIKPSVFDEYKLVALVLKCIAEQPKGS